jgi:hypothetical protein
MADIGFSEEASVYMIMIVISILCHTYYQWGVVVNIR